MHRFVCVFSWNSHLSSPLLFSNSNSFKRTRRHGKIGSHQEAGTSSFQKSPLVVVFGVCTSINGLSKRFCLSTRTETMSERDIQPFTRHHILLQPIFQQKHPEDTFAPQLASKILRAKQVDTLQVLPTDREGVQ